MTKRNDQERAMKRCAACGEERPVSEMKTCMHNQMHRYVCDAKCMHDFYNPPKKATVQQPASVAVPDAGGAVIKIAAALCTVALREIENAMDSPRLSRGRLENALAACKDRLGGYAIDLRRPAAPHPVSGEQQALRELSDTSRVPDDYRNQATGCRAGCNDCVRQYSAPPAAQDVSGLVEALDSMVCAYRSAIATGYDRITALGGQCDGVDYMLAAFQDYAKAKALVAAHRAQAQGGHDSDCSTNNRGVPELLGPCDCSIKGDLP